MRRKWILAGMVVWCLLVSLGLQAQEPDSNASSGSGSASTNPPVSSQPASGTIPRLVKFSGTVKESTGNVPTGVVSLIFSLYEQSEGGTPLWTETQNLQLDPQGRYTALLGANTPGGLPLDLFTSGMALWVGIQPQLPGQAELPRVLLVAAPYALKSSDADTLGGLPASAYMLAPTVGTTQAVSVPTPISFPPTSPVQPPSAPTNGSITGGGTTYFMPVFMGGTTIGNSSIYNTPGGQIGIGTTVPAATLHVNGTGLFTSTLTAMGAVLPAAGAATSTEGFPSSPLDWIASSFDSSTSAAVPQLFRWQAEAADNNSAGPSATLNLQFLAGTGTPSETGLSISSSGRINFAAGQTFPGTGSGTVTSVASGAGLTGGPITSTGTISIATGGVTNAMLANPSLTITAGSGLSGGGSVALGGNTTLSLNPNVSGLTGIFTSTSSPVVSGTNSSSGSFGELSAIVGGTAFGVYGSSGYGGVFGIGEEFGVYGSGASFGVYAIGTTSGSFGMYGSGLAQGVYGSNATNNSFGILGASESGNAVGVYGSGNNYGTYGVGGTGAYGSGSTGVAGVGTGSGSIGLYGSGVGQGVYGINSTNSSYGELGTTDAYGNTVGVLGGGIYGVSGSGSNTGVFGSGSYAGVSGSGGYYGVNALGTAYGVFSTGGTYGVVGVASTNGSIGVSGEGTGQGVYGLNSAKQLRPTWYKRGFGRRGRLRQRHQLWHLRRGWHGRLRQRAHGRGRYRLGQRKRGRVRRREQLRRLLRRELCDQRHKGCRCSFA